MALTHWRFLVRDAYGYAVQNAKVNVYLPGTSTDFDGNAYDAASGGSAVTNPMTTNNQGEVEAWFDTEQEVDVQVDDNSNLAYRAVEGSATTISFTTYTESDTIFTRRPSASGLTSKTTKTSTTEATLHTLTVPANSVLAGTMFRIRLHGYQTNGTTAITFTFRVRWGGVAGTSLYSLALVGTTTAHTDNPVNLEFLVNIQTIGATGTAVVSCAGDECITTATANTPALVVGAQASAVTIDTTADKDLVLTLELSATTGSPDFEVDNILIEQVA